ncbi:Rrf2 family transcriptional regulator [Gilvibacter sp. SZ-19]|uniref:RrF2 family transcriptional regulator n=1 Tax=Gilvibacter sp. SZ-19 TaxID=754429 RepID=UPI000B3C9105|nr:Rrf2 family transcriptional regulator [Gilvibacter sp. SZ-19]
MTIVIKKNKRIFLSFNAKKEEEYMLSKSAQYAVKALIHLAANSDKQNKILASNLAKEIDVPKAFLSKILQQLAHSNLVSGIKGPNGGFYLSHKQKQNSVYRVILIVEGRDTFGSCVLGLHQCDYENPCAMHDLIAPSQTVLKENLKRISILQAAQGDTKGTLDLH